MNEFLRGMAGNKPPRAARERDKSNPANLGGRGPAGGLGPSDAPQKLPPLRLQGRPRLLQRAPLPRDILLCAGARLRLGPRRLSPPCLHVNLGSVGV